MQRLLMPALVVTALIAGVVAGVVFNRQAPLPDDVITVLTQPRPVQAFSLTAEDGSPFDQDSLQGRWTLLFAGFRNCPDICPDTLARMAALRGQAPDVAQQVQMVFLSVDPQRDAPAQLDQYTDHFDPAITGVTGDQPTIDRLMGDLGLAYLLVPLDGEQSADAYTVDHSAAMVLLDPQARVAAYLPAPHDVDAVANALKTVTGA